MNLEISHYFTVFSELLVLLSENANNIQFDNGTAYLLENTLDSMELETKSDPILKNQRANVLFYRSSIDDLFLKPSAFEKKIDFILSLYREKVNLQSFYVEMIGMKI